MWKTILEGQYSQHNSLQCKCIISNLGRGRLVSLPVMIFLKLLVKMVKLYWLIEHILKTFMGLARTRTTNLKGSSWQGKQSNKQIHVKTCHIFISSFPISWVKQKTRKKKQSKTAPIDPTTLPFQSTALGREFDLGRENNPRNTKRKWSKVYIYEVILHILPFLKKNQTLEALCGVAGLRTTNI